MFGQTVAALDWTGTCCCVCLPRLLLYAHVLTIPSPYPGGVEEGGGRLVQ